MEVKSRTQWVWGIAAAFFLVPLFTLICGGVFGSSRWDGAMNSDLLQPFLVTRDAMRDPSSLLSWYHSPSIYFFPDWLIATSMQMLSPLSPGLQALAYSGTILTLYVLAFAYFLSVARISTFLAGIIYASAIILAVMCLPLLPGTGFGQSMTMHLATAFIHTGAMFFGLLFCAGLLAHYQEDRISPTLLTPATVLCSIVAFLICYSDQVVLPWFIAPAMAAVIAVDILSRRRPRIRRLVTIFVAALAGTVTDRSTRPFPVDTVTSYRSIPGAFASLFETSIREGDTLLLASVTLTLIMAARGVWLLWSAHRTRQMALSHVAELILIAATCSSFVTPLVTGAFVAPSLIRYALPIFLLPYLWIGLLLAGMIPPKGVGFAVSSLVLVWVVVLAVNWKPLVTGAGYYAKEPELSACLRSYGLTEGYSDYWNAKRLMWLSGFRLHLSQLNDVGDAYRYNFNGAWFQENAATGKAIQPNFLLPDRLDEDMLKDRFGEPTNTLNCAGKAIWVYNSGLPILTN